MAQEEECSICLEKLTGAQTQCVLPCKHVFHTSCILTHVQHGLHSQQQQSVVCPICRAVVVHIPKRSEAIHVFQEDNESMFNSPGHVLIPLWTRTMAAGGIFLLIFYLLATAGPNT